MWRLSAVVLFATVLSELIGLRRVQLGPGVVLFVPLLYAFAFGALINPHVSRLRVGILREPELEMARAMIVIAILPFVARFGTLIGPSFDELIAAGPALVLQELGNLATMVLAMPVAVLVFGLGREAIGACYSIAREPNIAIISDRYGLSGPEGTGVMSVYVVGTLFGTLVFAIMASLFGSIGVLAPEALAMACGVGSGSMMAACAGALAEVVPGSKDELLAFAGASNLLTYATGLYAGLFVALPIAERLYRRLVRRGVERSEAHPPAERSRPDTDVASAAGQAGIVAGLIFVGNWIATGRSPVLGFQGVLILYALVVIGLATAKFAPFYLPSVAWISLLGIVVTLPVVPFSELVSERVGTIDVLPAATPCLVYAGLAITSREVKTFRRSGWRLTLVALLVFVGTYTGSAVIAHGVLRLL